MELIDSNVERSYLSLQPPPGRVVDDRIQFESIDWYLWTGSQFSVPSLLFYAGPVYQEERDNINSQPEGPTNEVGLLGHLFPVTRAFIRDRKQNLWWSHYLCAFNYLIQDYFLLTIELGNMLHIRWNMGGAEGNFVTPGFSLGFSEILVTR